MLGRRTIDHRVDFETAKPEQHGQTFTDAALVIDE